MWELQLDPLAVVAAYLVFDLSVPITHPSQDHRVTQESRVRKKNRNLGQMFHLDLTVFGFGGKRKAWAKLAGIRN